MQSTIVVVVVDDRMKMLIKNMSSCETSEKVVIVRGSQGLRKTQLQDLQLGLVM